MRSFIIDPSKYPLFEISYFVLNDCLKLNYYVQLFHVRLSTFLNVYLSTLSNNRSSSCIVKLKDRIDKFLSRKYLTNFNF